MFLEINGYKINYIDEGDGIPVLLLHGWGSSLEVWNRIINFLKTKNKYRIVALDFPGCGKSDLPPKPMALEDYTGLVVDFCLKLNISNPIILGHSNGGRVTLSMLGNNLITARKAVLFGSAGLIKKSDFKKKVKIASFKTVKFFLTLPLIRNYTAETLKKARGHFGSSDYNNAPEVMRKTLVNLVNSDLSDILPNIKCPVLLIWGENDTAVPLCLAQKMEKLIPDAGLCVIKGGSHFAFLEYPGQTNLILGSFLN